MNHSYKKPRRMAGAFCREMIPLETKEELFAQ